MLLRQVPRAPRAHRQLAALLEDYRAPRRRRHERLAQVRPRVYQIALGYEDRNDTDELRHDAVLQLARGAEGHALSSQPTRTRLEHGISGRELDRLRDRLEQSYVASLAPSTSLVVLDIDSTDDPAHGAQEQVAFHGFYDQHMDHPLLVFDATPGSSSRRCCGPGRAHAARGAATILERLIRALVPSPCGLHVLYIHTALLRGDPRLLSSPCGPCGLAGLRELFERTP